MACSLLSSRKNSSKTACNSVCDAAISEITVLIPINLLYDLRNKIFEHLTTISESVSILQK